MATETCRGPGAGMGGKAMRIYSGYALLAHPLQVL